MKNQNILSIVVVTLFLCLTNLVNAQSEIYGTWTAGCTLEKNNISSMSTCGICPTKSVSASAMNIESFEINITENTIQLGKDEPVSYTWDKGTNGITFLHNKSEYAFKVLIGGAKDIFIWKEISSGMIVVLQLNKG